MSANVRWHPNELTREERWSRLGIPGGATAWLTGLSGSGKSTIATAVERRLVLDGRPAYMLDGDNLRHGLNAGLGFSDDDRHENVRRVAEVARLFADAGVIAVVSLISPFAAGRDAARKAHEEAGLPFVEVWVKASLDVCAQRDPKALYARTRRGEIASMTGIGSDYEPPPSPDLVLDTEALTVDEAVEQVIAALDAATGR